MSRGIEGSIAAGVKGEKGDAPVGPLPNGVIPVDGSPSASFGT